MRVFDQIDCTRQYDAFIKLLENDFPYKLPGELFDNNLKTIFQQVYSEIIRQHSRTQNVYYSNQNGHGFINLAYLDHYLILCYRFSHALSLLDKEKKEIADAIYYSCRVRTSTDVYYKSEIGEYFLPSHPLGTVIDSKAKYGLGLRLYNGVHIGPYGIDGKPPSEWTHPIIGNGVIIYANSSIYGKTIIGNNVTISPGTTIVNEKIPDNCIVFGTSPDLKAVPNKHNNLEIFGL